jgi:hypothetical protein
MVTDSVEWFEEQKLPLPVMVPTDHLLKPVVPNSGCILELAAEFWENI